MKRKLKRRIRQVERRMKQLEKQSATLVHNITEDRELSTPLDIQAMWRDQTALFGHGTDDSEDWNPRGYL